VPTLFSTLPVCLLISVAATAGTDTDEPPIPYPHPVITEVFFHVPGDTDEVSYDANADGERDARTDEFIELFNPHPRPIQLEGYTLVSRLAWKDLNEDDRGNKGVRFTFPEFTLEPGYAIVIFNTVARELTGDVGTEERAPERTNERFDDAFVFGVSTSSRNRAFRNSGDFVLLLTPDNEPVECVHWGKLDIEPPRAEALESGEGDVEETVRTNYRLTEADASPKGSVVRSPWGDDLRHHVRVDGRPFSPGEIVIPPDDTEEKPGKDPGGEDER
jgi:hypothetical protein